MRLSFAVSFRLSLLVCNCLLVLPLPFNVVTVRAVSVAVRFLFPLAVGFPTDSSCRRASRTKFKKTKIEELILKKKNQKNEK
ncbi:hypothetical protein [Methanimicrococcus hongohii]|uniref:hypothetical protein n=1 Tax=Methanimicrococcus hongohii TaxID=3028295 RepID=UPI0029307D38|nr:hypothetical protein [Methanimicrococcus sp. Hf6]